MTTFKVTTNTADEPLQEEPKPWNMARILTLLSTRTPKKLVIHWGQEQETVFERDDG